jgi:uncharacterized membrane protein YdjX (TVP38/TMEM64 family)
MTDSKPSGSNAGRFIILAAVIVALVLATKFLPVAQWLQSFNEWVRQMGPLGFVIFVLVYAAAAVLLAPGSILTLGAGFAFGLWKGFLAVSAGATLGAALAFLVARFIARSKIESIAYRNAKFRSIDQAIGREGAKLIFLLRLSPVIPFSLSNYFYGLTAVRFWPYVLASWLGMIPGTFLYVYVGAASKAAVGAATGEAVRHGWEYWSFLGIGLIATVAVTVWVTRIAQKALQRST